MKTTVTRFTYYVYTGKQDEVRFDQNYQEGLHRNFSAESNLLQQITILVCTVRVKQIQ